MKPQLLSHIYFINKMNRLVESTIVILAGYVHWLQYDFGTRC